MTSFVKRLTSLSDASVDALELASTGRLSVEAESLPSGRSGGRELDTPVKLE